MTAVTQTDSDFAFRDPTAAFAAEMAPIHPAGPLGPLVELPGTWKGHGFNTIWRPHHGGQDRFLMLTLTDETLVFTQIKGAIPNRGLLMPDIDMFGITICNRSLRPAPRPASTLSPESGLTSRARRIRSSPRPWSAWHLSHTGR